MVSTRKLTVALTALALAAGAAACGDDDEDSISTAGTGGATGVSETGDVAADAEAKAAARTAQTVVETLSTDQGASYAGIDAQAVAQLEPSLAGADLTVTGEKTSYAVTATSSSGVEFTIDRSGGAVEYTCEPAGTGGCPAGGDWS